MDSLPRALTLIIPVSVLSRLTRVLVFSDILCRSQIHQYKPFIVPRKRCGRAASGGPSAAPTANAAGLNHLLRKELRSRLTDALDDSVGLYLPRKPPQNTWVRATLIVHCHRVLTMDARPLRGATSVGICRNRIIAVGTRRQVGELRGRHTAVLDYPHGVLIPGFIDAHTHFYGWACRPDVVDLVGVRSMTEALRRIARAARKVEPGRWVLARGFDKNHWQGTFPSAVDLDAVTGDVPTQVISRDGHTAWVNTAALRLAGITARTPSPPGGSIHKGASGRPTGILQENAIGLLPDVRSSLTDAQKRRALLAGISRAHRYGVTCVHSVEEREALLWFQRLRAEGRLTLRVRYAIPMERLDDAIRLGLTVGLGDNLLRLGGVKLFADGALGSQTAYMFEPYPGRPDYFGVPVLVGAELRQAVVKAAEAGLPCWVHAIGDRANHEVIDALAGARRSQPAPLRHRIEHAQCVRPADARRMGRLKIIASMQPCHIVGDMETAERHWPNVLAWTYPVRSLLKAGAPLAFGSDIPVETFDPVVGLHAAVNRQTLDRTPPGGWQMREAIGVLEALRAYTAGGAYAAGDETQLGRIAPGMLADFVLLSEDPLAIPRERLLDLRVLVTVCNGKVVFTA